MNKFILAISKGFAWLNPILILLIMADLILRYIFSFTTIWIVELEWHIFSLIFLLGGAYTLKKDKHVRVDIIYQSLSSKYKNFIDIIGHLFLLIPWCLVIIISGIEYTWRSYAIMESSPDPSGLPFRFLIKAIIPISFILVLLQSLAWIFYILKTRSKMD